MKNNFFFLLVILGFITGHSQTSKKSADFVFSEQPQTKTGLYKQVLSVDNAVFMVFKSRYSGNLSSFQGKSKSAVVTSKGVSLNNLLLYGFKSHGAGRILYFSLHDNDFISGNLEVNKPNNIYDIIIFHRNLSNKERMLIESKLSIQYGISLYRKRDYYSSSYEIIWDAKDNAPYLNRVSGIGIDPAVNLFGGKGQNIEDHFIQLQFSENTKSDYPIYFIWGDNNQDLIFNSYNLLERKWKFQSTNLVNSDKKVIYKININKIKNTSSSDILNKYDLIISATPDFTDNVQEVALHKLNDSIYVSDPVLPKGNTGYFTLKRTSQNLLTTGDVSVFPNPGESNNNIFIRVNGQHIQKNTPVLIEIYNMAGEKIFNKSFSISESETKVIPVRFHSSGQFLALIHYNNKHFSKKIIIGK